MVGGSGSGRCGLAWYRSLGFIVWTLADKALMKFLREDQRHLLGEGHMDKGFPGLTLLAFCNVFRAQVD
jgi:hypothetical protein